MLLEFPEYLPDLPAYNNPGMTVATNVIPAGASYKPVPELIAYSNALGTFARGAISTRDPQFGSSYNFAGDGTKLYALGKTTPGIWDDVSKVGGYTTSDDEQWSFTQFGARVIATNFADAIQSYVMGTSTLFADLSVDAPKARYIDTVRDFVMVANTYDSVDGFVPNRVRWSGIGDSTAWTVSAVTLADFQDLDAKYGWITQLVGGDYGLVFQERAITRMDFVGSPVVFQFTTVERDNGTKYADSVVPIRGLTFYIGLDGFYVFDGQQSVAIGSNKVDNFFFADLDTNNDFRISSAVDYNNHLIIWAYPGQGNINGTPNKLLIYNYSPNAKHRWSYVDFTTSAVNPNGIEYIYSALSEGYTLDQLDDWESAHGYSKNIDVLPYSLDSRVWDGNNILYGAFDSSHKLAFNSTNTYMTAVLDTAEIQLTEGQRSDVFRLKPYVDGSSSTVTVQIGTRNLFTEAVTFGSPLPLDVNGEIQCRSNARYHRMRVDIAGGFTHAIGVEVLEFKPAGYR